MKRGVFDILRRALDNTVANWPLIAIRLGELLVFVLLTIATAVAILAPMLVSIGVELTELGADPDEVERVMLSLLEKWIYLVWLFLAMLVLTLLFVAVHAFVEAGCARVYIDAERVAGPALQGPRARFKVFSMQRWISGGKDGWWSVFWIYNFAWGIAGLVFLIPLIPTAALMFLFRETPAVLAATGCLGMVVTLMLMIVVSIVTGMWTNRAIAEWGTHRGGAATSLSAGWQAIKADLGRHLLIAIIVLVAGLAGSSFFSSFGFFAAFGETVSGNTMFQLAMMPVRLLSTLLSWIFSTAIAGWYLAAYSAMAAEGHR